jgi:hypothetical protein
MLASDMKHEEIQLLNDKLSTLEVSMLQNRLAILELIPVINSAVQKQDYEKAAKISKQKRLLTDELTQIKTELDALTITPKPLQSAMHLFIFYNTLQLTFNAHQTAIFESIDIMKNKLEQLNESKKELDIKSDKEERLKVFQEIVDWTETLKYFSVK